MIDLSGRRVAPWQRFHVRTTALYAVPLFAVLAVVGVLAYQRAVATEHDLLRSRLRALSVALASAIDPVAVTTPATEPPSAPRARLLTALAAVGRDQPEVVAIYVLTPPDPSGTMRFIADWDRRGLATVPGTPYDASAVPLLRAAVDGPRVEARAVPDAWGPTLSGYAPITDDSGHALAVLGVDIAAHTIAMREREAVIRTVISFGVGAVLLMVVGAVVGWRVRRPLDRIVATTTAVAAGELTARVGLRRKDELGLLAAHFDRMAAGLEERERIRAVFGRYVSEDVARAVLSSPAASGLGGDLREVTVLFGDLRGYSTIVEHLPPADVITLVNSYLDSMASLVDEHGGCVLELLGDGVLAVFGAPVAQDDHAMRAMACARAMLARIGELDRTWQDSPIARACQAHGMTGLGMRIGVHTGKVVAGNIGGATRMKYAVLGDAVNVAARLEQLNKELGTTLLFSAATRARLPADAVTDDVRPLGARLLKGRDQPVEVFTIDPDHPPPAARPAE